jgi:hypothetical protein
VALVSLLIVVPVIAPIFASPRIAQREARNAHSQFAIEETQLYRLTKIEMIAGNPVCFINGQELKVGDRLGDAQVVDISADRVTISRDGRTIWLLPDF